LVEVNPGTMPGYDRFWLDDGQRRAPVTPEAGQTDPQQAVPQGQFRAFSCGPPKHPDLVAQSQVLELEGGTRTEDRGQSCEECRERNEHQRRIVQEGIILIGSDSSRFSGGTVVLGRNHSRHWCRTRRCQIYSALRASMGSVVAARSAGTIAARTVTITRVPATPASVEGS
jgi:hypothetical protein